MILNQQIYKIATVLNSCLILRPRHSVSVRLSVRDVQEKRQARQLPAKSLIFGGDSLHNPYSFSVCGAARGLL
jgi:hypothetical protein